VNDHPLPPAEFDAIYAKVPRLTVELLVTTAEGVVLTRRSIDPCRGQWHLPGGTVQFGESVVAAAERVALDELGVRVAVGRLLGYIEYPLMHRAGYPGWPVGLALQASVVEGRVTSGSQSDGVGYFRSVPADMIAEQARFLAAVLDDLGPGVSA
jgi:ADP-ribose pyrophosphatase YjhB (NUDIX family)